MKYIKKLTCALLACACLLAGAQGEIASSLQKKLFGVVRLIACAQGEIIEDVGPVQSTEVTLAPTPEATIEPEAEATAEPTAEPTEEPAAGQRLAGLRIGIDPGHQGEENRELEPIAPNSRERKKKVSRGTAGVGTRIAEYVTNLEVALKLRDALLAEGCEVYMTRETHDVNISNRERAQMMNELGVDLVLRLHCDGSTSRSANGIGMFVRKTGEKQAESEAAAAVLLDAMVEATGAKKRGVYLRDTYTMNNWSIVPCILVEMGYLSNYAEDKKLNSPEYQDLLVEGMVEGIAAYFERSGSSTEPDNTEMPTEELGIFAYAADI